MPIMSIKNAKHSSSTGGGSSGMREGSHGKIPSVTQVSQFESAAGVHAVVGAGADGVS